MEGKHSRAFVIPESWVKETSEQLAYLNSFEPLYSVVPIPDYEKLNKALLRKVVMKTIQTNSLSNTLVVLPKSHANGQDVKYWPDLFVRQKSQILIISVLFADKWSDCVDFLNAWVCSNYTSTSTIINATCQYQSPYTDILDQWNHHGSKSFHPGDYFKDEFLQELKKMEGHWFYWGHSDSEHLYGYNALSLDDLLNNAPAIPLDATLWFSCSTLDSNEKRNIALDWFLSNSTCCLFASNQAVKTVDNFSLSLAWLEMCQLPNVSNIADVIHNILSQEKLNLQIALANYRLLGVPWGKFTEDLED